MKTFYKLLPLTLLAFPALAYAQFTDTQKIIAQLSYLVSQAIILAAGVALLVFIWGLAKFIMKAGDEKSHAEGKSIMIWGLGALFVMLSVWGLIRFIQHELFPATDFSTPQGLPGFKSQ